MKTQRPSTKASPPSVSASINQDIQVLDLVVGPLNNTELQSQIHDKHSFQEKNNGNNWK